MSEEKLKDHIGLLQDSFEGLLQTMYQSIGSIQRDAAPQPNTQLEPNAVKFEQLPEMAEQIVKRVKEIDTLIDEANETTCIGKDISVIQDSLKEQSTEYEEEVKGLSEKCEDAELWLGRIRRMLDVIAKNTPWMVRSPTK